MATTSYLDRLLDPLTDVFTSELASAIVSLRADPELETHISELRRKANDGTLTVAEDAEYLPRLLGFIARVARWRRAARRPHPPRLLDFRSNRTTANILWKR